MSSRAYESDLDDADEFGPLDDQPESETEASFRVSSPDDEDLVDSPDAACELICDMVTDQFWAWYADPARARRFKPHVKVYEVAPTC